MTASYDCPECNWRSECPLDLYPLTHHDERVSPGEIEPAGECPECGALIECPDNDIPDYTLTNIATTMRARGWVVVEPGEKA